MKLYILIFASLIYLSKSLEEQKYKKERLTYKESFDENNTHYLINTKEEYKEIINLKKTKI